MEHATNDTPRFSKCNFKPVNRGVKKKYTTKQVDREVRRENINTLGQGNQ